MCRACAQMPHLVKLSRRKLTGVKIKHNKSTIYKHAQQLTTSSCHTSSKQTLAFTGYTNIEATEQMQLK